MCHTAEVFWSRRRSGSSCCGVRVMAAKAEGVFLFSSESVNEGYSVQVFLRFMVEGSSLSRRWSAILADAPALDMSVVDLLKNPVATCGYRVFFVFRSFCVVNSRELDCLLFSSVCKDTRQKLQKQCRRFEVDNFNESSSDYQIFFCLPEADAESERRTNGNPCKSRSQAKKSCIITHSPHPDRARIDRFVFNCQR